MILGIAEDFTSSVTLDSQLVSIPSNGIYLNTGVNPSITTGNLLSFLPNLDVTFDNWSNTKTYSDYTKSRNKKDLVKHTGKVYQSLKDNNLNHDPDSSPEYWLETNIESLRIKSFLDKVKDRALSTLNVTNRLVNNQKIYSISKQKQQLPNNYCGWTFEAKGSDYTAFRLNQISLQKDGTTPVDLYVINQNELVDTLSITPSNGKVSFTDLGYSFKGDGQWHFVIDSTEVYSDGEVVDPLKYDGFVCYTCSGIGESPEAADYSISQFNNGIGFNITVYLDAQTYIENNINEFGSFLRATFEYMCFELFYHNSNNRSNRAQVIQMDDKLLHYNLFNLEDNTVARRYENEKKQAIKLLSKTFDTQLSSDLDAFEVEVTSV